MWENLLWGTWPFLKKLPAGGGWPGVLFSETTPFMGVGGHPFKAMFPFVTFEFYFVFKPPLTAVFGNGLSALGHNQRKTLHFSIQERGAGDPPNFFGGRG